MVVVFFFESQNLLGLCPKHNYKETHAQPCDKETLPSFVLRFYSTDQDMKNNLSRSKN